MEFSSDDGIVGNMFSIIGNFVAGLFDSSSSECFGAGIGSGAKGHVGKINIRNSSVTATGGTQSAGIGSSKENSFDAINIEDSTVSAKGGDYGAGIGSGNKASGNGTIYIENSKVNADGGTDAAGIGGGEDGNGGVITINGSTVYAESTRYGAAIGCGEDGYITTVRIDSNSTVTAKAHSISWSHAVGTGMIWDPFVDLESRASLGDGLLVDAGSHDKSVETYSGKERYNAIWDNAYAKIYPCQHNSGSELKCEGNFYHHWICKECGAEIRRQQHIFNDDLTCTVCGMTAEEMHVTLIDRDSSGEYQTVQKVAKYTDYVFPEPEHTPNGMKFLCWVVQSGNVELPSGIEYQITSDLTLTAYYLPVIETTYIDEAVLRDQSKRW